MRVWPDTKYFDSPTIPLGELTHLLRSKAVLLPGVKVMLVNEKTGDTKTRQYQDGLRGYLAGAGRRRADGALFEGAQYAGADHENFAEGEGAQWVVAWTEDGNAVRESYVNLIPTPAGGTHESGLREGRSARSRASPSCTACCPRVSSCCPRTCSRAPASCCRPRCWIRSSRARSNG